MELLIDHANIIELHEGPKAFAMEPNVIANPFTEALLSEGTEEFINKKLAVKAIQEDILAQDEQNKIAPNMGISCQTYAFSTGINAAPKEQNAKESRP